MAIIRMGRAYAQSSLPQATTSTLLCQLIHRFLADALRLLVNGSCC